VTRPALLLAVLLPLLLPLLAVNAPPAGAQEAPWYRLRAELDVAAHTIRGELELELDAADPRVAAGSGDTLWFHLPPNRFTEPDPRGRRRNIESLTFATGFEDTPLFDPMWPAGFSRGGIAIESVEAADGTPLPFTLEPNPAIPLGYSVHDGLMRVSLAQAPGLRSLRIRFVTRLPRRYWEGWSRAGVLVEEWYPLLANRGAHGWDFDVFAPRPGRYEAEVRATQAGQLFLGHGWNARVEPDTPLRMPPDPHPLRAFALVFIAAQTPLVRHDYQVSLYAYHSPGHERLGRLALRVARDFLGYVRDQYGLPPPDTRIAIVEVDLPPGDIRTVGSLVLVPREYFQSSALLDRVFVAQLTRAVAQVWFGETVWSNRDRQSWLHLGLSGYLALDYFHSLFGWDAGVHDVMDWLQPRYREHFFEAPVRALMRGQRDAPLMLSLQEHAVQRTAVIVAHNKAPLVLRSLYHVVGHEAFVRGLNALYVRHRHQEVTERTLERILSATSGLELDPFFARWFHGTPQVNFAIEAWEQESRADGYAVYVDVARSNLPLLPVDVRVLDKNGQVQTRRWDAGPARERLTFLTSAPVQSISIDPEEHWLEVDRKDNHSGTLYRVRPLYDWPKQRELLVALRGTAGGNSIDGNYLGAGVHLTLNENNALSIIPIAAERTGLSNYQVRWYGQQLLLPELGFDVTLQKLGGATRQAVGLTYQLVATDEVLVKPGLELRAETVTDAGFVDRDGSIVFQPRSRVNNVELSLDVNWTPRLTYASALELVLGNSHPSYGSDFDYTSQSLRLTQTITDGSSHLLRVGLTRAGTTGTAPLQTRHTLGGPQLLRGYPRTLELSNDEIAAATLDYGWVVFRDIVGVAAQLRRVTLYLFGDVGRGWNNDERLDSRPQRQDLGVGMELTLNVLRLAEFPLRFDIAWPVSDDEYRDPQFILLGLLNF
jgi:hypothetical protein